MKFLKLMTFAMVLFLVACKTTQNTQVTAVSASKIDAKQAQGGMWIPSLLEGVNETEMQNLGMKMTAKDIYDVNNSSLKDAIVHFNGGCTAEIISSQGLLLTNHHCGYGQIQSHSSVDNDYLQDGFWAMNKSEELKNPGMFVTFINRIDDVTAQVLEGVLESMDLKAQQSLIDKNIAKVTKNVTKETWQEANVKSFYKGNQYILFVTEKYTDIRLVGAPPTSIGKFGSDTDNWMWPRHTGDFSMFRIYADKNNRPATYAADNVPYTPKHFLPVSLDGVAENDFTLVFGFPGRTNEYLPAVAIDQIVNTLNPVKIDIRANALKIVDGFMRSDKAIKIKYASKYASIANYWKKWIGENQGIAKSNAIAQKVTLETEFSKRVAEKDLAGYSSLLSDFETLYAEVEKVALARDYWVEVVYRNVELLNASFKLYQLENAYTRGGEAGFNKARIATLNGFKGFYKNYSPKVDEPVFARLVQMYKEGIPTEFLNDVLKNGNVAAMAEDIYANSALVSFAKVEVLLNGTPEEVIAKLNADSGYKVGKALSSDFYNVINPKFNEVNIKIAAVQKKYMKALTELFPNKRFFPDANSTLRVTYGQVKGYDPVDGVSYGNTTYLGGVMEKFVPGDYEFDVPKKLQELYKAKDFGQYGVNGKMPVCFIGTNHTTGGNSGSPAIDAHGNLIGLNFDRVWEGTMSDLNYDAAICRNIMVDVRYILFIVDKFAGATHLIDEMKLVHPKK
ncbi:MAG: S46 family peptidase [Flavobacteriaceae bacterium]|nr:S46 family peptidase [Flavobacteriaceae bacterium]